MANETLADMALQAERLTDIKTKTQEGQPNSPFDLSPIQQFYADLAFGQDEVSQSTKQRFNYSFYFRLRAYTSAERLSSAFEAVTRKHAMLRSRFRVDGKTGIPYQLITEDISALYRFTIHDCASIEDARKAIEQAQTSLDIRNGPLASVDLVNTISDQFLFLTILVTT
ncbi:CoA-dependent acyltransferase [Massarina eburnea CBS 473.64]|uniref:CoA-dependent acyltransferase n=1 Tax=Massarina eburnea CBS 473.64 TaxID=1395130 RepID=A0A6A6RYE2_9PLEO|nr:CoA-dependent acyltransferase [Massarina eburnea CBS 473.64]